MFWQLLLISWKVWRRPELRVEICLKDKELRGCLDICLLCVSVGLQKDWVNIIWDGYVLIKMSASKSWNGLSSSRFLIAHCVCVNALTCTQYICTVYIAVSGLSMALSLVSMLKPIKKAEYQSSELQRPYYF
jgi:hypothetical protein